MLRADEIDALRGVAEELTAPIVDYLIQDLAKRVAKAGQLTATAQYETWKLQELGLSQREIKKQLKKLLKVSNRELRKMLTQSAKAGYSYDLRSLPQVQAIPFRQNEAVQQIVAAAVRLAENDLSNITQTIGMVDPYGRALPLRDAYRSCMDFAFVQVSIGAADYNTAIRQATKNLADRGVCWIDYESGVHTSLEAAVRRNVMGGLGLMQEQISQRTHDDLGADGWEIDAHNNSAPDHEPIQGKQYPDAEYQALNNSLVRRIGTLNCGHSAHPIILGVSIPQYSPEELERMRQKNEEGVTYQGKHYTGYEATQRQRRLEASIRRQKRRILVDEAAGDAEKLQADQIKLQILRQEYSRFSKAAGLRTQLERAEVAKFGWKQAGEAEKTFAKYSAVHYNKDGIVIVTDDWTQKGHVSIPGRYLPNAVIDTVSQGGKQRDRTFFDGYGRQARQVSNGPHSNPKRHPYGSHGEHAHDVIWENGKIIGRPARELTDSERKENGDIL
nr:MAG TPA: minor capsid protein [Caudoviricetes sp.]